MTRIEQLDWLYKLKSEIKFFMPHDWVNPMEQALSEMLEQKPKWIPVSERLPEGLLVKTLVSCEDSLGLPIVPKVVLYDDYEHSWECEEKVIAWMPLPEPYKAESEVQDANSD